MKIFFRVLPSILCIILLLTSCGKDNNKQGEKGMPPNVAMNREEEKVAVETSKPEIGSIGNEYTYSGTTSAKTQADVYSTLSGKVVNVNFNVGDTVKKGDVLFTMDTTDIQNNIREAQASLKSADASINSAETNLQYANGANVKTQIENAKNSITNAENDIENAKTNLNNAEIALNKAKSDYETNVSLYDVGGISKETLEQYKNTYDKEINAYKQAELNLEKANDSYEQALSNYDIVANMTPEENLRKAEANLETAKASRESTASKIQSYNKSLSDAVVTSPISGVVSQCNVTAGTVLSQGAAPFVILDLSSINVEVNVSEQIIGSVKINDLVNIKISSISDNVFSGNISEISPTANNDGTYTVKIEIDNNNGVLKSGMFAEVSFMKEQSDNTIILPRSSVINKNDEYYVFVEENGVVSKAVVSTGIDTGDKIEIVTGIDRDSNVVTKGQTYLKDGDNVNVVNQKKETQSEGETYGN